MSVNTENARDAVFEAADFKINREKSKLLGPTYIYRLMKF